MLRKETLLNCILLNVAIFSVNELRREELVWIIFCFDYIKPLLSHINTLKTKVNPNYILIIQSVPRSKHSSSRLRRRHTHSAGRT
jgi:hypothetical protein